MFGSQARRLCPTSFVVAVLLPILLVLLPACRWSCLACRLHPFLLVPLFPLVSLLLFRSSCFFGAAPFLASHSYAPGRGAAYRSGHSEVLGRQRSRATEFAKFRLDEFVSVEPRPRLTLIVVMPCWL